MSDSYNFISKTRVLFGAGSASSATRCRSSA